MIETAFRRGALATQREDTSETHLLAVAGRRILALCAVEQGRALGVETVQASRVLVQERVVLNKRE